MRRIGRIVKLKPEMRERYVELHANPWPEVTKAIRDCQIRNFSIYLKGEYLFSYFEYIGEDYSADMERLDNLTKGWLAETDRCQEPVAGAEEHELWSTMNEVFYQE